MSDLQTRPPAPAPIIASIPAELQARVQWVVWRYEQSITSKWTKIPYTPGTTRKAAVTRPSTWRSFMAAVNAYTQNPHGLDGIGYVFTADDPYAAGDIDHCIVDGVLNPDTYQHLPETYAEISPSGTGIKFIARASGSYSRKTKRGELYSSKRFFTITGNVLDGHTAITSCQEQIDAFAATLGSAGSKATTAGTPGHGNRADLVKEIPVADWDAARQLTRTDMPRLTLRLRKAAGEETQLAYLLRGDYAGFHAKWGFVGLYRSDGVLDDSMVRAVAANSIKGRGFTFPEYVALMSHLYGAQALAKWGAKERWREELAALWRKAQAPRYAPQIKPKAKAHAPVGRPAGQIGAQTVALLATITSLEPDAFGRRIFTLAQFDAPRRTTQYRLQQLRQHGRLATGQLAGNGYLYAILIEKGTSDGPQKPAETRTEESNGRSGRSSRPERGGAPAGRRVSAGNSTGRSGAHALSQPAEHLRPRPAVAAHEHAGAFRDGGHGRTDGDGEYRDAGGAQVNYPPLDMSVLPVATPENAALATTLEETKDFTCVSSEDAQTVAPPDVPPLADLAEHYLSTPAPLIGKRVLSKRTHMVIKGPLDDRQAEIVGEVRYRRTAAHFAELVAEHYGAIYAPEAARAAYQAEQQRRKDAQQQVWADYFARLRQMTRDELVAYIQGMCRSEVADLARDTGGTFDKRMYQTRLKCAKQNLAWRGFTMPAKPTKETPVTPAVRPVPAPAAPADPELIQPDLFTSAPAAQPRAMYDGWGMIARLQRAAAERQAVA